MDIRILVKKEKKITGSMEKGIEEMEKIRWNRIQFCMDRMV